MVAGKSPMSGAPGSSRTRHDFTATEAINPSSSSSTFPPFLTAGVTRRAEYRTITYF
jgi:hypothetical protein